VLTQFNANARGLLKCSCIQRLRPQCRQKLECPIELVVCLHARVWRDFGTCHQVSVRMRPDNLEFLRPNQFFWTCLQDPSKMVAP
jgi:hypothetical protein